MHRALLNLSKHFQTTWSQVDKRNNLDAMQHSVTDSEMLKFLLRSALTDKIADREIIMKGIDYSYYYEEND